AKANSRNPKTTFTLFSHPPDFGILFSQLENRAKSANGIASASAKPNIPIAGPNNSPIEAACTSKVPIIGPVQEKETSAKVAAIKNNPVIPLLCCDLSSILFTHEEGRVISKAPKNDMAKTTSI